MISTVENARHVHTFLSARAKAAVARLSRDTKVPQCAFINEFVETGLRARGISLTTAAKPARRKKVTKRKTKTTKRK